jgi:Novel toxin 21
MGARFADDTGAVGLPGSAGRLTNSQAGDLADWLGYRATKFRSHGQRIFTDGKTFITQDVDSHLGGTWKMANSVEDLFRGNRTGTYDFALNRIAP